MKLGSPNKTLVARVIADQTLFAPTNLFVFLSTMAILEGKDPAKKIASTYKDTLIANWTVWPVVQTVNFKFVPLEGRVLFVNFVSLGEFRELIQTFKWLGPTRRLKKKLSI